MTFDPLRNCYVLEIFAVAALLVAAVHVGATHLANEEKTQLIVGQSAGSWTELSKGEYRLCNAGHYISGEGRAVLCSIWYPELDLHK
jgi:hypothetical protein